MSLQNLKNEPLGLSSTQSHLDFKAKEIAINTENQINMFERTHNIGVTNKKPNMYPKKELISHGEIL